MKARRPGGRSKLPGCKKVRGYRQDGQSKTTVLHHRRTRVMPPGNIFRQTVLSFDEQIVKRTCFIGYDNSARPDAFEISPRRLIPAARRDKSRVYQDLHLQAGVDEATWNNTGASAGSNHVAR